MPNHIKSVVTIRGPREEIQKLLDLALKPVKKEEQVLYGTDHRFDFSAIVPEPEDVVASEIESSTCLSGKLQLPLWYTWRVKHWGTKWNSYDFRSILEMDESTPDVVGNVKYVFAFSTAWSCPCPIFIACVKRFPKLRFTVEYADEDIGHNCGTVSVRYDERKDKGFFAKMERENEPEFANKVWETY